MSPTLHSLTCDIILTVNSATKSFLSQKEKKKTPKILKTTDFSSSLSRSLLFLSCDWERLRREKK